MNFVKDRNGNLIRLASIIKLSSIMSSCENCFQFGSLVRTVPIESQKFFGIDKFVVVGELVHYAKTWLVTLSANVL